jgi:hypothetical protein
MEIPPHLYPRYGIRKRRFPFGIVAGILIILTLIGYPLLIQEQVSIRLISWQATEESAIINWRYEGEIKNRVWCLLEAQDEKRFDIGFALLELNATDSFQSLQHELKTSEKAFAVLTPICNEDITRLPGSYFKPGVLPPAQLPPLYAPWQLP